MPVMLSSKALRVAAVGLGFVLAAWSTTPGCGSGGATATTTTTSTSGTGGSGGGLGVGGGIGGAGGSHFTSCKTCLDTTCATELAACDTDCIAIQACLDAVCENLSATMAADEGACQVHCQSLHPAAKANHLAVVNCVQSSPCQPPCAGYSFDFDTCVTQVTKGTCKSAVDACTASTDCTTYEACAMSCATLKDCLACATVTGGAAGEALYEASQHCIETTCIAPGWLHSL